MTLDVAHRKALKKQAKRDCSAKHKQLVMLAISFVIGTLIINYLFSRIIDGINYMAIFNKPALLVHDTSMSDYSVYRLNDNWKMLLKFLEAIAVGIFVFFTQASAEQIVTGQAKLNLTQAYWYPYKLIGNSKYASGIKTAICKTFYVICWTMLFVIPGLIKKLSYSMTPFLANDAIRHNKLTSVNQPITDSRTLMSGHKWEYLVLYLSVWIWYGIASCIIVFLFMLTILPTAPSIALIVMASIFLLALIIWRLAYLLPYWYAVKNRYYEFLLASKQADRNLQTHYMPKWFNLKDYDRKPNNKIALNDDQERHNLAQDTSRMAQHDLLKDKTVGEMITDEIKADKENNMAKADQSKQENDDSANKNKDDVHD